MGLELTVDEIIDTIKRSSLTSVLVEGVDDVMIYRWIEEELGVHNANFFPCGGRDKVLQIFDRRDEFPNSKVVFVADRDAFVYTNIPDKYNDIIWTNGYSIENDLYYGRNIEKILSSTEQQIFIKSLDSFIDYYSFEVEKIINKIDGANLRYHPQHIICELKHEVKQDFLKEIGFTAPSNETKKMIKDQYDIMIRGKSLFALLTRLLNKKDRIIKHSKNSLLEHCYRTHRSIKFSELLEKINAKIIA